MTIKNSAFRLVLCGVVLTALVSLTWAEDREDEVKRINNSAIVLNEIMSAPDKGIPEDVMQSAVCVGVAPSLVKGGFIFGAEYGKGVASCRTATGWSAPAPFKIVGGSWGLQIGGEAVDMVMLVMNHDGMEKLLSSKFKLGADASVAAGPVGRHTQAETDWKMKAEVLTYSRARGVFAGLSVNGAVIEQDDDATRAFYGHQASFRMILQGKEPPPSGSAPFLSAVRKFSAKAEAAKMNKDNPGEHN